MWVWSPCTPHTLSAEVNISWSATELEKLVIPTTVNGVSACDSPVCLNPWDVTNVSPTLRFNLVAIFLPTTTSNSSSQKEPFSMDKLYSSINFSLVPTILKPS